MEELSKKVDLLSNKVEAISATLDKVSSVYSEVLIRISVLEKVLITTDELKLSHTNELSKSIQDWKKAFESEISKLKDTMKNIVDEELKAQDSE